MKASRRAELALLIVTAVWGLSFPIIKLGLQDSPPLSFLALRFGLGLVAILVLMRPGLPARSSILPGVILGLVLGGSYFAQTAGLVHTTPARSAFITALSVILVPILYPLFTRRLPGGWPLLGAVIAAGGLYLLTDPGTGALNRGDIITLGCALAYAVFVILLEVFSRRHPYRDLLIIQVITLAALFVPLSLGEGGPHQWTGTFIMAVVVAAAILVTSLWLQNRYQKDTTATKASVIYAAEPVFAALFSFFMFQEVMGPVQWGGASLIVLGILASERR